MDISAGCDGRVCKIGSFATSFVSIEALLELWEGPRPEEFLLFDKSADAPPISKEVVEAAHEPAQDRDSREEL